VTAETGTAFRLLIGLHASL